MAFRIPDLGQKVVFFLEDKVADTSEICKLCICIWMLNGGESTIQCGRMHTSVNIHLNDTTRHCNLDILFARPRATVEDEEASAKASVQSKWPNHEKVHTEA